MVRWGFFIFLLCAQKKNETKRKGAGCRCSAKKTGCFRNKKNSLRSNSFLFFSETLRFFFTHFHSRPEGLVGRRGKKLCFARFVDDFFAVRLSSLVLWMFFCCEILLTRFVGASFCVRFYSFVFSFPFILFYSS